MRKVCLLRSVTGTNLAIWNFTEFFLLLSSDLMETLILLSGCTCILLILSSLMLLSL